MTSPRINSVSIMHYTRPYIELARLEKPTGSLLIFWPFEAWGLTMAAFRTHLPLKYYIPNLLRYLAAAIIIRSCGCTVNDIVDRNIDGNVSRTKKRPLPSGRISVRSALLFLVVQYLVGIVFFVAFLEGLALRTALWQLIPM
ncbi:hypothetical protein D9619_008538 [Psilocybe cf. subviscida]|uniref:Uncharacterized protein n=1 Tax=Psilocybe cf. subviscida TaxID=2480587 RepID=A0A8H5B9U7_9AGAR|nr:hypothetical protein D9619_008538 [Psilocybe cf. subviscida]